MGYRARARNTLYGLAIGDAISWPSLYHRTYTLPFWTRRLRREIDAAQETKNILRFPMPFSLNRPTEALQFAPADDTEWATFTAKLLIHSGGNLSSEYIYESWLELAHQEALVKGSISVQGALHNLRRGWKPPTTGMDNAHYFDDSACVRAIPIGVALAENRDRMLETVTLDAIVTNAHDGLWAAQAMAMAIAELCSGSPIQTSIQRAQAMLPSGSWIERSVNEAIELAGQPDVSTGFRLIPKLDLLVNKEYSYGGAAPEAVALAFAVTLLVNGNFELGIMHALAFPKLGDSLPALVGALCGAASDVDDFCGDHWTKVISELKGICLPQMAGMDYLRLVNDVVMLSATGAIG